MLLAERLVYSGTTPSGRMRREDVRKRVRTAMAQLAEDDREVLVLRHLEQLSTREIAAILEIAEWAARRRQRRALERLTDLLRNDTPRGGEGE